MSILWALVAVLIVYLITALVGHGRQRTLMAPRPRAEHILDARYARCEISLEEYRARQEALRHG